MDHHPIEAREILPEPLLEPRRVAVTALYRTQRVHRKAPPLNVGLRWVIQANKLHAGRCTAAFGKSADALCRPSRRRREGCNDMQEPRRGRC
jgi:hypothetical protein